jgi:glycosyltransferase involved in cell wall biosynthesis
MFDPDAAFRSLNRIESGVLKDRELAEKPVRSKAEGGVTIFTPTWNHRPYLPRAVRSALSALEHLENAGYDAELLVVDDASRDGSQKLLRTIRTLYEEPRLKTIFLKSNLGLSRLRNLALREAEFRYICWLDADNELLPENLPLFLRSMEETGAAVAHGNLITVRDGEVVQLTNNTRANMHLSRNNHIDAFALFDAEKLLRIGGYHPWFYRASDWEMIQHLIAEEEKIVFVPAVLGYYYINPGSMSRKPRTQRETITQLARRVYSQTGTREWDLVQVGRTYHPELGYLD